MACWIMGTESFTGSLGIRYHDPRGIVIGNDPTGLRREKGESALSFDRARA